jgi:hypothetical protein
LLLIYLHSNCSASALAQNPEPVGASRIVSISTLPPVSARIEIRASDRAIILPYCQGPDSELPILYCNQGLEHSLEYFNGTDWVKAKPEYPGEVFGFEPDKRKPATIEPGKSTVFRFTFNRDTFHVQKGQKLRLEIEYWSSEQSMIGGKSEGKLTSPVFECP